MKRRWNNGIIDLSEKLNGIAIICANSYNGDRQPTGSSFTLNGSADHDLHYTYDAWGEILTVTGTDLTLANRNPIRYRGYYYDSESGLYYLQSRYYDPELKRFISPDNYAQTYESAVGANMFAYCGNEPVVYKDDDGNFLHLAIGALIGIATVYISDFAADIVAGESIEEALKPNSTLVDYGAAALSGALAASGVGIGVSIVANAAINGITYLADCEIQNEQATVLDLGIAVGIGAASGAIGGKGANGKELIEVTKRSNVILAKTVSTRKIAMYTTKKVAVRKTVIKSVVKTAFVGFMEYFLNIH